MAEKRYKPSTSRRKKEKTDLQEEVRRLQSELEQLHPNQSLEQVATENTVLLSIVRQRQGGIASAQSICTHNSVQEMYPLYSHIRLNASWDDRSKTLSSTREHKFRAAYEYITTRSQLTPWDHQHLSDERFETANGDVCCVLFQTVQFPGVKSLKQVHDAVVYSFNNAEISISERLGHITTRDDYDCVDGDTFNARIISTNDIGVATELNSIMFSQFFDGGDRSPGSSSCGMVVIDSVDEDELNPYAPRERLRKDVSAAIVVTDDHPHSETNELTVTLRRAVFVKLYRPEFQMSEAAWQESQQEASRWGEVLLRSIRSVLYSVP